MCALNEFNEYISLSLLLPLYTTIHIDDDYFDLSLYFRVCVVTPNLLCYRMDFCLIFVMDDDDVPILSFFSFSQKNTYSHLKLSGEYLLLIFLK